MSTNLTEREIQRPHFQSDDVVESVDEKGISQRATRYLFFAGDTVDRPRKRDLFNNLGWGGIEVASRCIVRGPENFIPRCTVVPLEIGTMQYPKEHVAEGRSDGQINRENPNLIDLPCYPGAHIGNIISRQRIKGLIEITPLQGIEWKTGEAIQIQNLFFPPTFKPHKFGLSPESKTLCARCGEPEGEHHSQFGSGIMATVEKQIESVASQNGSDIQDIAVEMFDSCKLYRAWGMHVLDKEHNQIKSGKDHNWTHRYSEKGLLLIDELGQSRADQALNSIASIQQQMFGNVASQQGISPEMLQVILAQNSEQIGKSMAEAFAQYMPKPVETPVVEVETKRGTKKGE